MTADMVEYDAPPTDLEPAEPLEHRPAPISVVKSPADYRSEAIGQALASAYANASKLELTKQEADALAAEFPDEAFRLGAGGDDNLVYIEHAYLRHRLNEVLGVGASVPIRRREWSEEFKYYKWFSDREKQTRRQQGEWRTGIRIYVDLILVVRGCLVGEAIADSVYYPDNPKTNYSDALEGAKSNAFRRCAKEFGVGLQAWMKGWVDGWKDRNGKKPEPARQQRPQQQQRQTAAKPAESEPATEQRRPAPAPAPHTFSNPAEWPNTTLEELHAWIERLATAADILAAKALMFGEDTPFMNMGERDPLIRHLHKKFHAKYDTLDDETKGRYEAVRSQIDDMLATHESEMQVTQERF